MSKHSFFTFVKKQRFKILVIFWQFMLKDLHFKGVFWYWYCWNTSWNEYYLRLAQLVSSKQSWARRWAPEHVKCSLQISPWCGASLHPTIGNLCTLRAFVDRLVATNRRTTVLLHKHCIRSFKIFCLWKLEAFKVFGRGTHSLFTLQVCQSFSHEQKKSNSSLLSKSFPKEFLFWGHA